MSRRTGHLILPHLIILTDHNTPVRPVARNYDATAAPGGWQELRDSPPSDTSNCRYNYSDNSAAVSSVVFSTGCCCCVSTWFRIVLSTVSSVRTECEVWFRCSHERDWSFCSTRVSLGRKFITNVQLRVKVFNSSSCLNLITPQAVHHFKHCEVFTVFSTTNFVEGKLNSYLQNRI
jgi:hypothetical protein